MGINVVGTLLDDLLRRHAVAAVIWVGTNCAIRCSLNLGPLEAPVKVAGTTSQPCS